MGRCPEIPNPYADPDLDRLLALVRIPGVLNGNSGILQISATRADGEEIKLNVDLGELSKGKGLAAIIPENEIKPHP